MKTIKAPTDVKRFKWYVSCGAYKRIVLAPCSIDACAIVLHKLLIDAKKDINKLDKFMYVSEAGFKTDIEKYCEEPKPPCASILTEHILRELGESDLSNQLGELYD